MKKIVANSGDSHILEPEDLWEATLPRSLADRMPRTEKFPEEGFEIIQVDGQRLRRPLPPVIKEGEFSGMTLGEVTFRPPGSRDVQHRLIDLDNEGIWGEVVYPSIGLWNGLISDAQLYRAGVRAMNDWMHAEVLGPSRRLVPTAQVSCLDVRDAVAEIERTAELGFRALNLPTRPHDGLPDWNSDFWEPVWSAAERANMVICFHIGTDASVASVTGNVWFHGPGGAVLNYAEAAYSGLRATTMMIASGALDRHPQLRILVSEGGATWVPYLGDRMDEGYRQHGMFVRPKLSRLPSEILYEQVYASFQHDRSAVETYLHLGYRNVMWGSDYPHIEGTYGHTQETLHTLFDGLDPDAQKRITQGAFLDLFPEVGEPAPDAA
jgi:predicted TIM-barrel fold metal-dependent hydrolase